jgi:hypothetical protein
MLNKVFIAIIMSVILISCNGQTKSHETISKADTNAPHTDIKVKREFDKNGNLVKFDSTYSYYYSNVKSNSRLRDSIFNNFKNQFNHKYFFSKDPFFNDFFFSDSLLKYDFYKKDFFLERFRNNMNRLDSLFWGMDSLKNNFYGRQFKVPLKQGVREKK